MEGPFWLNFCCLGKAPIYGGFSSRGRHVLSLVEIEFFFGIDVNSIARNVEPGLLCFSDSKMDVFIGLDMEFLCCLLL